jgi:3-hydroxymyristoyl/3-hydroxydecanoyl-(acyl carrier protein) dehydratase
MVKIDLNYEKNMMDNLFIVKSEKSNDDLYEFIIKLTENHKVFDAHFKDYPLLPGFLQIDIAIELLKRFNKYIEVVEIKSTKFKKPIFPNDELFYKIVLQNNNIKLKIKKDKNEVLSLNGQYVVKKD